MSHCETQSDHAAPQAVTSATPGEPPRKPHILWLGGWGIAAQEMLAIARSRLPQAEHSALAPTRTALATLRQTLAATPEQALPNKQAHSIAGYSTGAFLLLRELPELAPRLHARGQQLLLLAPFVDFRAESDLGGRVVTTRLKLLLRRLRNDPLAAIADFYRQSNITLPAPTTLPYPADDLIWGIEQLAQTAVCAPTLDTLRNSATRLPIRAWAGAQDTLLDAEKIATLFAPGICHVVADASHDLASLLAAANVEGGLAS